jgi:hypothetical protein
MRLVLIRAICSLATTLTWASLAPAHSNPPESMASTKAVFFTSGIQQRLELAIRANDPTDVAQILSAGADVNARGKNGVTPLMISVDAQAPGAVAVLLRAGADTRPRGSDRASAVHLAVENHAVAPHGHAILEMIMKGGGDPNTRRPDDDPVLMRFAYDHDLEDIRWFKSLGADVDIKARTSRPLIADIAFGQNWDSVWCLIELGAKYDYEDTLYPLSEALDSNYASSPDAKLYPYKMKVWQLLKDKGLMHRQMKRFMP